MRYAQAIRRAVLHLHTLRTWSGNKKRHANLILWHTAPVEGGALGTVHLFRGRATRLVCVCTERCTRRPMDGRCHSRHARRHPSGAGRAAADRVQATGQCSSDGRNLGEPAGSRRTAGVPQRHDIARRCTLLDPFIVGAVCRSIQHNVRMAQTTRTACFGARRHCRTDVVSRRRSARRGSLRASAARDDLAGYRLGDPDAAADRVLTAVGWGALSGASRFVFSVLIQPGIILAVSPRSDPRNISGLD